MQPSPITLPNTVYRVSTKAFITDEEGRLFMIWEGEDGSGGRELPGGGLDFGEEPVEGLKREIMEELGVEIEILDEKPLFMSGPNEFSIGICGFYF